MDLFFIQISRIRLHYNTKFNSIIFFGRKKMKVKGELDELMEENDWALIFGDDGRLKGIFIPEGSEEADCPTSLLIMLQAAGIDLRNDGAMVH